MEEYHEWYSDQVIKMFDITKEQWYSGQFSDLRSELHEVHKLVIRTGKGSGLVSRQAIALIVRNWQKTQ